VRLLKKACRLASKLAGRGHSDRASSCNQDFRLRHNLVKNDFTAIAAARSS
jgi:hypothetical protein